MQEKTIFQKIYDGEIPSNTIYKDETMIIFLDINPVTKGHALVVSKDPYPMITDVPENILSKMTVKSQAMINKMKAELDCDFVMVVIEGIDVPHFHIHLIPRKIGDNKTHFEHEKYSQNEASDFAAKLSI